MVGFTTPLTLFIPAEWLWTLCNSSGDTSSSRLVSTADSSLSVSVSSSVSSSLPTQRVIGTALPFSILSRLFSSFRSIGLECNARLFESDVESESNIRRAISEKEEWVMRSMFSASRSSNRSDGSTPPFSPPPSSFRAFVSMVTIEGTSDPVGSEVRARE